MMQAEQVGEGWVAVRLSLAHLPVSSRDRVWQEVVKKADRDELCSALQRVYVLRRNAEIELEFWFQNCSSEAASLVIANAVRDAALLVAGAKSNELVS